MDENLGGTDGLIELLPERWPARADLEDRRHLVRGQRVRRIHNMELTGPSTISTLPHRPLDVGRMVRGIINRMEASGAIGYSWAIVQNGQLRDAGGVGYARTTGETEPRQMTEQTRMVSASLAKPLCALVVARLIEDGAISLDDQAYPLIESAFPAAHESVRLIRIRDLLTHRSGFNGPGALSQFAGALAQPLAQRPGISTRYENWNYWFLAHLIEGVTGQPYHRVANNIILSPMTITGMSRQVDVNNPCLYYREGQESGGITWGNFSATAVGAYGWFASAIDWAKLMAYFRYDQVLSANSRLTIVNSSETYFGFRHWFGQPYGTYYGHGGDFIAGGGHAFHGGIMGFPDGVDAVLLTNSDDVSNPEMVLIQAYHGARELDITWMS